MNWRDEHGNPQSRDFMAGQTLHTENSCKWTLGGFEALLRQAGFTDVEVSRDVEEGSLTVTDLSAFVEARDRCLTLISLSDEDYEAGRSRIQGALAQGMGDRLVATEVCTVSIAGTAPQA